MENTIHPPFVRLEKMIAYAFQKEKNRADSMKRDARHHGADVAITNVMCEVGNAFLFSAQDFTGKAKPEFLTLARESMQTIGDWLVIAADVKRNMGSLDPVWALDQLQPNLQRVLDEFRPKLM